MIVKKSLLFKNNIKYALNMFQLDNPKFETQNRQLYNKFVK